MFIRIIIILLFTVPVIAQDLGFRDYFLISAYITGSAIDAGQTIYALEQKNKYMEANPFIGKKPSAIKVYAFKLLAGGLLYYSCTKLEQKDVRTMFLFVNIFQWAVVYHNSKYVGLNLSFSLR